MASQTAARRFVVAIPESPVLGDMLAAAGECAAATGHHVLSPSDSAAAWREAAPGIDILILTPRSKFDASLIAAAPRLRSILFPTIGVDPIDVDAATGLGIAVGHSAPLASVVSMAQAAVALIASLMLKLPEKRAVLAAGRWREPPVLGRTLVGRTVGLVGYGRIGRATAALLAPWQARLLFADPAVAESDGLATPATLDELLRASDVVSLHANMTIPASPLIGRRELALMRRDAYLVNTSRGGLVDEDALADALEQGAIAGAALDAFAMEPLPASSRLRALANIVLTPHNAGHTVELMAGLAEAFMDNLRCTFEGGLPSSLANPAVAPAWRRRFGDSAERS